MDDPNFNTIPKRGSIVDGGGRGREDECGKHHGQQKSPLPHIGILMQSHIVNLKPLLPYIYMYRP